MDKIKIIFMLLVGSCFLTSCGSSKTEKTVRVLTESFYQENLMQTMKEFEEESAIKVEVESLSQEKEQREGQLKKIRTEIMAGDGPDVFLLESEDELVAEDRACLFANVNKTMQSGIFAPLDSYMEHQEQWNELSFNEKILEAGQYDGEQYVLPFGCTYFVYVSRENEKSFSGQNLFEWLEEAKQIEDEEQQEIYLNVFRQMPGRISQPAIDYETTEVLFEPRLWSQLMNVYSSEYWNAAEMEADMEESETVEEIWNRVDLLDWDNAEDLTYMVVPDVNGNHAAAVTVYGAVNMAAEEKEEACDLLFFLLNKQKEGIFQVSGVPAQYTAWKSFLSNQGIWTEKSVEEAKRSLEQIDVSFFSTEVEHYLYDEVTDLFILNEKTQFNEKMRMIAEEAENRYRLIAKE